MSGLLQRFIDALDTSRPTRRTVSAEPQPVVVGPRPTVIGPKPTTTVVPPARQAWDEKRWRVVRSDVGTEVVGAYRIYDRRNDRWRQFAGRVLHSHDGVATYIADPPVELKRHRHGPCLQLVNAPWFRLHWHREPKTIDDALLYVERLLDEAINS